MRYGVLSLLVMALTGLLHAQTADVSVFQVRSHYIGEPVTRFLRLDPNAREEVEICREHSSRSVCNQLLAAIDGDRRGEISVPIPHDLDHPEQATDAIDFVIEAGKVIKLVMPVTDLAAITKNFGHPSSELDIAAQNTSGAKWENHLSVWDAPDVYITIFQDNNPALQDRRPVLVMESRAEHTRDSAKTISAPQ